MLGCGQEEIELSRDGSHYSLSTGILPSLGAKSNRRIKLRRFILSPYDRRYRFLIFIFQIQCSLRFLCLNAVLTDFVSASFQYIFYIFFFFSREKGKENKDLWRSCLLAAVSLFSPERSLLSCFVALLNCFSLDAIFLFYSILKSCFDSILAFPSFLNVEYSRSFSFLFSILWPLLDSIIFLIAEW